MGNLTDLISNLRTLPIACSAQGGPKAAVTMVILICPCQSLPDRFNPSLQGDRQFQTAGFHLKYFHASTSKPLAEITVPSQ
jgi:hypothetical protein